MKLLNTILPLAALTSAFVIPDDEITNQILVESQKQPQTFLDRLQGGIDNVWSDVEETFKDVVVFSGNAIDNAINIASETGENFKNTFECHHSMTKFDTQGWLDSAVSAVEDVGIFDEHKPPHRRPKHPKHGHSPHKHRSNKTVYELINESKYTTKLAKLINEYPDLVDALNGTAANYTVFAPTDAAFEKIPKHHKKPSKELIKKVLAYHVSADFYPAGRVLVSHTIPTILGEDAIGGEAQRLRLGFGIPKGLNVNFYSRIIAIDIVSTPALSSLNLTRIVRYQWCHSRGRFSTPPASTSSHHHRTSPRRIQHPTTRTRKDWSRSCIERSSPCRWNPLRTFKLRLQETRYKNQRISLLQIW